MLLTLVRSGGWDYQPESMERRPRFRAALYLGPLLALTTACGSTPPALPSTQAPPPTAKPAEPAASAAPQVDAAAAQKCIDLASAKRAKFSGEPPKITVKHVLVKWSGSKNADPKITRSREEACLRAIEARDKIREGADFGEVVKQFSDEPGAGTREGSIGAVERKDVAKPFADAAFELSVNQMSDVVETESGFHVIFRSE
jgi:peptidyl-prolyl cis-trans isomerase NIMA-interacting 1